MNNPLDLFAWKDVYKRQLMTRPSLILADEPTGNLDTQNTSEVIALLKETSRKYEQTILMITHNRSIAQTCLLYTSRCV